MWGKMNMYEDAIRIPLVAMGPFVAKGNVEDSPVSLLDIFPTISDATGAGSTREFRGISLLTLLRGESNAPRNRYVLTEYHANGVPSGLFSISNGHMKYVHAVGARPMLFDLDSDPQELHDLAVERPDDPRTRQLIRELRAYLYTLCSPEEVDSHAKRDQAALRKTMALEGTLEKEIYKRGYERRADRLVPRPEFIPMEFRSRK
jgi:choline-sulfatase